MGCCIAGRRGRAGAWRAWIATRDLLQDRWTSMRARDLWAGLGSRWGRDPSKGGSSLRSERVVEVYEIKGRLTFGAMAWWDDRGAWGATSALSSVPPDADDEAVGSALSDMFDASARLPVETGPEATDALLKEAGVRSRAGLARTARYLLATRRTNGSVHLAPTSRRGGGWVEQRAPRWSWTDPRSRRWERLCAEHWRWTPGWQGTMGEARPGRFG